MKKLHFHPIGDLFTSPTLNAEFLPKARYQQITKQVQENFEELLTAVDIKSSGPLDARARAYAVVIGNDNFCSDNDAVLSIVELAAELVQQTLSRLEFMRHIEGAVYQDVVYAFKSPKSYADMSQNEVQSHMPHMKAFNNIRDMITMRNISAKTLNEDIIQECNLAISSSLFILFEISKAKFSVARSNAISNSIKKQKSLR